MLQVASCHNKLSATVLSAHFKLFKAAAMPMLMAVSSSWPSKSAFINAPQSVSPAPVQFWTSTPSGAKKCLNSGSSCDEDFLDANKTP
mmetsp:Transcript_7810/g.7380  ORF Transcript_7810/g.7380 Transcript_7810/m.7380 type:complete len:88 (+) Transcript_7810:150-413(+)